MEQRESLLYKLKGMSECVGYQIESIDEYEKAAMGFSMDIVKNPDIPVMACEVAFKNKFRASAKTAWIKYLLYLEKHGQQPTFLAFYRLHRAWYRLCRLVRKKFNKFLALMGD